MISTAYDRIAAEFENARQRLMPSETKYLALLLDDLDDGSSVLDLGCGTGHPIATSIVSRGHRVTGVDGSSSLLAAARRRLPDQRWMHDLIEHVDFDESFDAVVCWDALFHVPRGRWPAILSKVHRWLRPGGRFMLSSGGIVTDEEGFIDTMFGHEFYYDSPPPDTLLATLDDIGFDAIVAEMCDQPDGARNRGKWATVASRRD